MTTNEFERIESLLKQCDDHEKSLRESLEKTTRKTMEVKGLMSDRISNLIIKLTKVRESFDVAHRANRKEKDKIREKLDEVNNHEMEGCREYEEFKRKILFIKIQKRQPGIIRIVANFIYHWTIFILTFIGFYKPEEKIVKKKVKNTEKLPSLPNVSPSQHTLTVIFPIVQNPAAPNETITVPKKPSPSKPAKNSPSKPTNPSKNVKNSPSIPQKKIQ